MLRGISRTILIALAALSGSVAWGHGGAEELGHHWGVAAYGSEMRLQAAAMLVAVALYVAGRLVLRVLGRRSESR